MKTQFYLAFLLAAGLAFTSCEKEDAAQPVADDQELLRTTAMIDHTNEADFQSGNDIANDNASMRASDPMAVLPSDICADITITTNNGDFPKVFTLDFGTGCTDDWGITRSGILTITLTGFVLSNGSQMIIERDNYYINDYKVEGTLTFTNTTADPAVPQWTRSIPAGQITTPEGNVYTHSGTRTVRQIAGVGNFIMADNVYEVTSGTHSVTGPGDNTLASTIVEPLIKSYACLYISAGVLNLQGSWLDGDLDYGDGTCDAFGVYTHEPDGQSYNVILN